MPQASIYLWFLASFIFPPAVSNILFYQFRSQLTSNQWWNLKIEYIQSILNQRLNKKATLQEAIIVIYATRKFRVRKEWALKAYFMGTGVLHQIPVLHIQFFFTRVGVNAILINQLLAYEFEKYRIDSFAFWLLDHHNSVSDSK